MEKQQQARRTTTKKLATTTIHKEWTAKCAYATTYKPKSLGGFGVREIMPTTLCVFIILKSRIYTKLNHKKGTDAIWNKKDIICNKNKAVIIWSWWMQNEWAGAGERERANARTLSVACTGELDKPDLSWSFSVLCVRALKLCALCKQFVCELGRAHFIAFHCVYQVLGVLRCDCMRALVIL